jgi:hypothetical protein
VIDSLPFLRPPPCRASALSEDDSDAWHDAATRRASILSTGSTGYASAGDDGYASFGDGGSSPSLAGSPTQAGMLRRQQSSGEYWQAGSAPASPAAAGARAAHLAVAIPASPPASPFAYAEPDTARSGGGGGGVGGGGGGVSKLDASPGLQIPILARVRALEERLPRVERPVRRHLPDGLPSASVGQGTLVARVAALERAMDVVLRAQEAALAEAEEDDAGAGATGCSSCCCVM